MASSSALFQSPTSPRPLFACHCSDSIGRRRVSVRIPTAALSRRKPFRHIVASAAGSTLSLSFVKRKLCCYVVASSSTLESAPAASDSGFLDALERCFAASPDVEPSSSAAGAMLSTTMKKEYGAHGAVTLEKSKLDLSQKTTKSSPELATGGGGGDIGKKNFHGGGDGGDDDGDDDDYFDDFDDGDEGDEGGWFRRRIVIKEFFDRKFIDAVFNEWYKTMADLPGGLRQACEMGLLSSAQLVRFLSINARPTTSRLISRALSPSLSRAWIGRMIADPSFLYKLILEQVTTIGSTVWWELKSRKGRIKEEWDLAFINVMTVAACNAFIVWSLAPCRSYGSTFRFDLQNSIQKLPNNIFEKSYPMREFDLHKRIHSFFYKAAELCLVGLTAGSIQGSLTKVVSSRKEGRLSVTIPSLKNYALGYGAFLGLYANLRYQLICGIDRAMFDRFDVLGVAMFFGTVLRVLNIHIGETSRLAWLGIEAHPLLHSDTLLKAYIRPSDPAVNQPSSNWFISKDAIISGLGLLGLGQKAGDSPPSKPRRKRILKKKVSRSST
ncbi:protein RETICULATA-RELATED 1, chloroplastic [Phalaenopsis equestris]|uniref:protein RETICULATA-RELATED 1, chloroplastic n=1 Tax=Phalaenopsis equestris TaxID=78828 RepID=UPI0009E35193|nr:protein RETICULATA-RELATED 1, chloroplastic [Phalaenopsis equestris]